MNTQSPPRIGKPLPPHLRNLHRKPAPLPKRTTPSYDLLTLGLTALLFMVMGGLAATAGFSIPKLGYVPGFLLLAACYGGARGIRWLIQRVRNVL